MSLRSVNHFFKVFFSDGVQRHAHGESVRSFSQQEDCSESLFVRYPQLPLLPAKPLPDELVKVVLQRQVPPQDPDRLLRKSSSAGGGGGAVVAGGAAVLAYAALVSVLPGGAGEEPRQDLFEHPAWDKK